MTDDTNICACPVCTFRRILEGLADDSLTSGAVVVRLGFLDDVETEPLPQRLVIDEPHDAEYGYIEL